MPEIEYNIANKGRLARNDKKKEGSQQPDWRGSAVVGDVEYEIAGWDNLTKNGNKPYIGLKFNLPKTQQRNEEGEGGYRQERLQPSSSYPQPQRSHSSPSDVSQSRRNTPVREDNPFNDDDSGIPF